MLVANTLSDVNISSALQVFSYTWRDDPVSVLANIVLGSQAHPIAGGGSYYIRLYLNGVLFSPDPAVTVDPNIGKAAFQSRSLVLNTNDVLSITAQGLPADTAVDVTAEMLAPDVVTLVGTSSFSTDGSLNSLEQIRLNIIAKLNDLTYYKPTYSINGQSVQSSEYRASLWEELKECETRIRRANNDNFAPTTVPYTNNWRSGYGRSPFLAGGGARSNQNPNSYNGWNGGY